MIKYENPNLNAHFFKIDDYGVNFPFQPYESQKNIIRSILSGLKTKQNSIIESPTGTGKCLSALTAVFTFLKSFRQNKTYVEERNKKIEIQELLRIFNETEKNVEKLVKNFRFINNSSSLNKVLKKLKEIITNFNPKNQLCIEEFPLVLIKHEVLLKYKNEVEFLIAQHISEIFSNYKYDEKKIEDVQTKLSDLSYHLEIGKQKLFDQLKFLKFCHSFIYVVRTSSQIDIVYEELSKVTDKFNTSFLKSRNFFCTNEKLNNYKGTVKNRICKKMLKKKKCRSFLNFKEEKSIVFDYDSQLIKYRFKDHCPYYSEKRNAEYADLIVCTYNYLFSKSSRDNFLKFLVNPVIVIDEAHNIVNACEEFLNFKISLLNLVDVIGSIINLYEYLKISTSEISIKLFDFEKEEESQEEKVEEENKKNKLMKMIKNVLGFLLVFTNNLIFLNQKIEDSEEKIEFLNQKKSNFNDFYIFKVFTILLREFQDIDYDAQDFFIYQEIEFEFENNINIDINSSCDSDNKIYSNKKSNLTEKKELIEDFRKTYLNFKNFTKILGDLKTLNEKSIDIFGKEIPHLEKIIEISYLLLDVLLPNYQRSLYKTQEKSKKPYIEDYFLTISNIEINQEDQTLIKILKEYKEFIIEDRVLFNFLHPDKENEIDEKILNQIFKMMKMLVASDEKFKEKVLSLICMNPAICFNMMKHELNPISISLLSGTLKPFDYYSTQLGISFDFKLENKHIVSKSNVKFYIFQSNIFNKKTLKLSFTKENFDNYGDELFIESVKIINDFSKNSGKGNLIFIKNYSMLKILENFLLLHYTDQQNKYIVKSHPHLHHFDIYKRERERTNFYRRFFIDSNVIDSSVKDQIMKNYKKSCREGKKSYLISVMRGLFSEGVNFDEEESSMIFVLGIPYPDITDDYVRLKMKYITDNHKKGDYPFNGDTWYSIQAMTALNQALGRAIRRKNDFSSICIIESNILKKNLQELISKWLKEFEQISVDQYNYQNIKQGNKLFYKTFRVESQSESEEELSEVKFKTKPVSLQKNEQNKFSHSGFVTFSLKK